MKRHYLNEYCTIADTLTRDLELHKRNVCNFQHQLDEVILKQQTCEHSWDPPRAIIYDPHYIRGAEVPILQKIKIEYPISHWSRFCNKCGLVQKTEATKEEVQIVPDFAIPLNEV